MHRWNHTAVLIGIAGVLALAPALAPAVETTFTRVDSVQRVDDYTFLVVVGVLEGGSSPVKVEFYNLDYGSTGSQGLVDQCFRTAQIAMAKPGVYRLMIEDADSSSGNRRRGLRSCSLARVQP